LIIIPILKDKDNLYSTVTLDLYTAVLGGELTVNTFDGKVKLKVTEEELKMILR
jgi:DnaJ-class molecular chaperone